MPVAGSAMLGNALGKANAHHSPHAFTLLGCFSRGRVVTSGAHLHPHHSPVSCLSLAEVSVRLLYHHPYHSPFGAFHLLRLVSLVMPWAVRVYVASSPVHGVHSLLSQHSNSSPPPWGRLGGGFPSPALGSFKSIYPPPNCLACRQFFVAVVHGSLGARSRVWCGSQVGKSRNANGKYKHACVESQWIVWLFEEKVIPLQSLTDACCGCSVGRIVQDNVAETS